ncbi:terpene synthase family protein [Catellatospora sichuanensis]|uniref:terpene synthase family protein n=1 Tax=Catellatospora sichuanensis TaxID=1969805 RepID=UPI0011835E16|nr:hypothetical protein [Catellatospora sichuanensis]
MTPSQVPAGPTGLGTSAAHISPPYRDAPERRRSPEVTKTPVGRSPRFDIPYPTRISPDVERARLEGLRWAREMGIVRDDAETAALDAPRYDRLAAYAYPANVGADLDLVVELMMWFFPFDDLFDGPLGRDPAATAALIDSMVTAMYAHRAPHLTDPPLIRAFLDLWQRIRLGTTESWRTRLHSDTEVYLRSYQWEVANRVRGRTPNVATYLEIRRHSIGVWPSVEAGERTGHFEIPHTAFRSEQIQAMRRLCSDVVVLVNDALSAGKDRDRNDLNLVPLLQGEEGLTADEAMARIEQMVDQRLREFRRLDDSLDRLHDDLNLAPAARYDLERYADGMRAWMRGNLDWSLETVRYRARPDTSDHGCRVIPAGAPANRPLRAQPRHPVHSPDIRRRR